MLRVLVFVVCVANIGFVLLVVHFVNVLMFVDVFRFSWFVVCCCSCLLFGCFV